jgi:glycosylphosphatidylinositol transamidase (GPIT) subunit GPI8
VEGRDGSELCQCPDGRQTNATLLEFDSENHVLIYLTGHGGSVFKFQDEILAAGGRVFSPDA